MDTTDSPPRGTSIGEGAAAASRGDGVTRPGTAPLARGRTRQHHLDGLRGVAALAVVVFHAMSAFSPGVVPDQSAQVPWWADSPIDVLYNGTFWVFVFFVLSGFVLAQASMNRREHFARDVAVRYLRLALPAAASVVVAWALLSAFPAAAHRLDAVEPSPWLRWTYQTPIPSQLFALREGLLGVFIQGSTLFNNVLWTMRIELVGSVCVYGFFQWCRTRRLGWGSAVLSVLVLAPVHPGYVAFALGAMLSLVLESRMPTASRWAGPLFLTGVLIGSQARGFAGRHGFGHWPFALQPGNPDGLAYPAGAVLVVAGVLLSPALRRFFAHRACRFLGNISFSVYLLHVPLLYTATAAAALYFQVLQGAGFGLLIAGFGVTTIALATTFEIAVDRPVLALNRRLSGRAR